MPPTNQTGKQRATRIPMDYYKKPNRVESWKFKFVVIATVLTVVWLGYGILVDSAGAPAPNWMKTRYSHGPVARVHMEHEADCEKCHINFAAFGGSDGPKMVKCQQCHMPEAAEPHSPFQLVSSTPNCGSCHRDHRGVDVNLSMPDDRFCTDCHQNLESHMQAGKKPTVNNSITSFEKDHPNFQLFTASKKSKDPGTIKFNHKYHMTKGIVFAEGGKPLTLGDLPADKREQYRERQEDKSATAAIQLDCRSCHEPYSEKLETSKQRSRGANGEVQPILDQGTYMQPIKYNKHCSACHPLNVDPVLGKPVEHGKQPKQIRRIVAGMYDAIKAEDADLLKGLRASLRPLPKMKVVPAKPQDLKEVLKLRMDGALANLFESRRGCAECHFDESGGEMTAKSDKVLLMNGGGGMIPRVWLPHAQFSHDAHAFMKDCTQCHQGAAPNPAAQTQEVQEDSGKIRKGAEDLMMPNLRTCQTCHSSSADKAIDGITRKAAGFQCAECHLYHRGQAPGVAQGHPRGGHPVVVQKSVKPGPATEEFFKRFLKKKAP